MYGKKAENMSAEMQRYIDEAEQALLHTYNRYQVVFDRGEGVYLYDMDGKNIWILCRASQCLRWAITMRRTTTR